MLDKSRSPSQATIEHERELLFTLSNKSSLQSPPPFRERQELPPRPEIGIIRFDVQEVKGLPNSLLDADTGQLFAVYGVQGPDIPPQMHTTAAHTKESDDPKNLPGRTILHVEDACEFPIPYAAVGSSSLRLKLIRQSPSEQGAESQGSAESFEAEIAEMEPIPCYDVMAAGYLPAFRSLKMSDEGGEKRDDKHTMALRPRVRMVLGFSSVSVDYSRKASWPELVGLSVEEARDRIKAERPELEVQVAPYSVGMDAFVKLDFFGDDQYCGSNNLPHLMRGPFSEGNQGPAKLAASGVASWLRGRSVLVFYGEDGRVCQEPVVRSGAAGGDSEEPRSGDASLPVKSRP